MDLRRRALEAAIFEAVEDNMGIYPQSIKGGEGAYEKRTEWMEGWNAAITQLTKHQSRIQDWLTSLGEHKPVVEDLLIGEQVSLSVSGDDVQLTIRCNDYFAWACSDEEVIELSELHSLIDTMKEADAAVPDSRWGPLLWICRKRGMRVQGAAYKYIPAQLHGLFDAAGPPRDIDFGNPYTPTGEYLYREEKHDS